VDEFSGLGREPLELWGLKDRTLEDKCKHRAVKASKVLVKIGHAMGLRLQALKQMWSF
jgi:hypothetical protein